MAESMSEKRGKPTPKPKPRSRAPEERIDNQHNASASELNKSPTSNNLVEALINHNTQLDESLKKYDNEIAERRRTMEDLQKQLNELEKNSKSLDDELQNLSSNNSESEHVVKEVERSLAIYERLKSDEKLFKSSCNDELNRLQKELESLDTDFSDATKNDLVAQLERSKTRLEAGRVELAIINRKVASVKRQIEQIPNRMELREYRLRFSELYNQVSATHRSTKQFFSLYNSLEDTKRYLEKELSLLNSIVDSYQLACTTTSGREEFLKQLQSINEGMRDTCAKVEKRHQTDKFAAETLQAEIQRLLDVKVAYEKCILELETECRRNDQLLTECRAIEGESKTITQSHEGSSSGESDNE